MTKRDFTNVNVPFVKGLYKKSFEYLNPLRNGSLKPFNDLIKQLMEVIKFQLSYFKS